MKLFISIICGFTLFTGCFAQNELPVADFSKAVSANTAQVLDVRTPGEFGSGHITGALNADWNNKEVFNDRTQYLDKNKTVFIYCLSGVRSAAAAKVLRSSGYNVTELKGGIISWKSAGLPLEGMSKEPPMSISYYDDFIKKERRKMLLVDFGASWCAPCKKMEPYLNKILAENKAKLLLLKVDGGKDEEVMKANKVESIPYLILYKEGKEVWRHQGFIEEADLRKALAVYL
jgi:rhodanese-related sulfurtransferase